MPKNQNPRRRKSRTRQSPRAFQLKPCPFCAQKLASKPNDNSKGLVAIDTGTAVVDSNGGTNSRAPDGTNENHQLGIHHGPPGVGDQFPNQTDPSGRFVDPDELEILTDISKSTWAKRRLSGDTPPYIKIGRSVRYHLPTVIAWMARHTRRSTSDRGDGS